MDIKKEPNSYISYSKEQDNNLFEEIKLENDIKNMNNDRYMPQTTECLQKDDTTECDQKDSKIVKKECCYNFQDSMEEPEIFLSNIKMEQFDNGNRPINETLQDQDLSKMSQNLKIEDIRSKNRTENVAKQACPVKIENVELIGCSYAELKPEQIPTPSSVIKIELDVEKQEIKKTEPVVLIIVNKGLFHDRNFVCGLCYAIFTSLRLLTIHKTVHTEFKSIKSNVKQKNGLVSNKPFDCDVCGFKSARFFDMKQHKMIHTSEKPFKCEFCEFRSSRLFSLKNHIMLHKGIKPFQCEICEFRSARSHDLKRHTIMSHSIENDTRLTIPGSKPFKCEICDFSSARSFTLKRHKSVHSGVKPLKCKDCSFTSARLHDLKRHILSHSGGDRPFLCDHCDFRSARSYDLKRHQLLHKEIKPKKLLV